MQLASYMTGNRRPVSGLIYFILFYRLGIFHHRAYVSDLAWSWLWKNQNETYIQTAELKTPPPLFYCSKNTLNHIIILLHNLCLLKGFKVIINFPNKHHSPSLWNSPIVKSWIWIQISEVNITLLLTELIKIQRPWNCIIFSVKENRKEDKSG